MFKRKIHNQKPKNDKQFNLKLFFALCLSALVPTMYQTVRTFIVSVNISAERITYKLRTFLSSYCDYILKILYFQYLNFKSL